jgi:hypothetical protein
VRRLSVLFAMCQASTSRMRMNGRGIAEVLTQIVGNFPEATIRLSRRNKGSLKLERNSLVATGTLQRERFERGQLSVWPYHIIIDDLHRGGAAAN